jgi:cyclopropane fatty-acyl-phospholipid synthase-like methyltransferase
VADHHADQHMTYDIEQIDREQSDSEVDPFTEGRYRQFARHLGSGFAGEALDVGCNTGRGGRAFRAAVSNATVDGVELVAERIQCVSAGIYRTVYQGFLGDVPDEAGPYDALLMGELIEHVPSAELDDLIEQSTRLLVDGGRLLLTTPNPRRLRSRGTSRGGAHASVHCAVALKQYLTWKGWEIETVSGSGRLSSLIGEKLPLPLYSSYLLVARKPELVIWGDDFAWPVIPPRRRQGR